jgi:CcmD family protein
VSTRRFILLAVVVIVVSLPGAASAQGGLPDPQALASQNLRGYTHMFVAYTIAWLLIAGWLVSIARRLARLEKVLKDG